METLQKNITIPVDGSDNSMKSFDYITELFDPDHNLQINIIHVMTSLPSLLTDEKNVDKDVLASITRAESRGLAKAKRVLENAKKMLVGKGFREEKIKMINRKQEAGIAREICGWAGSEKTDALVLSRRGTTDLETFFFGRVSNNVIEYCKDSPVWIIGGRLNSKKILLCMDASENAMRAADHAGFMLSGTDCEITIFHTLRHLSRFVPAELIVDETDLHNLWKQKSGKHISSYMEKAKDLLLEAGLSESQISLKIIDGSHSPANDIVKEAQENGYGAVVLGKRGASKVKEFLFGSVTRKILNNMVGLSVWVVQ
jgi:nucleotide-binding universal stress UspA family protein